MFSLHAWMRPRVGLCRQMEGANYECLNDGLNRRKVSSPKLLRDALDDLAGMGSNRDHNRMLVRLRFLERLELALQQRRWHEMAIARRQPARDEVAIAFEKYQAHIVPIADQDVAVSPLERRT